MRLFLTLLIAGILSITFTSCVTTVRATPTKIVVVKKLPIRHKVVIVKGQRFYKWNGKHYRKVNNGYVVVHL